MPIGGPSISSHSSQMSVNGGLFAFKTNGIWSTNECNSLLLWVPVRVPSLIEDTFGVTLR